MAEIKSFLWGLKYAMLLEKTASTGLYILLSALLSDNVQSRLNGWFPDPMCSKTNE